MVGTRYIATCLPRYLHKQLPTLDLTGSYFRYQLQAGTYLPTTYQVGTLTRPSRIRAVLIYKGKRTRYLRHVGKDKIQPTARPPPPDAIPVKMEGVRDSPRSSDPGNKIGYT